MKFWMKFDTTDNETFDTVRGEVVAAFNRVKTAMARGYSSGDVVDVNGNSVGSWGWEIDPDTADPNVTL